MARSKSVVNLDSIHFNSDFAFCVGLDEKAKKVIGRVSTSTNSKRDQLIANILTYVNGFLDDDRYQDYFLTVVVDDVELDIKEFDQENLEEEFEQALECLGEYPDIHEGFLPDSLFRYWVRHKYEHGNTYNVHFSAYNKLKTPEQIIDALKYIIMLKLNAEPDDSRLEFALRISTGKTFMYNIVVSNADEDEVDKIFADVLQRYKNFVRRRGA